MFGFLRTLSAGNKFINALVSGEFDRRDPVLRVYAEWFDERPARGKQVGIFIALLKKDWSKGQIADRLNGIIIKAMNGQVALGDALARELEQWMKWDAPKTPEQAQAQEGGQEAFASLMAQLRALDS